MSNTDAFFNRPLAEVDPEIFGAIGKELGRQRHEIELIASENIVSRAVLEAQGSIMTNKYAEGYPGKRYYGGCQFVDIAEELAIERAKKLFGVNFANVQPNSGSQMNQAVFAFRRYEDASLAKRVISAQAKRQGVPAEAFVQQINAMVPMLVSTIGNKDFEKKVASAAGAFLEQPKSLTISARPKQPLPFAQIMGAAMMAPQSLPTVVGAEVSAND